MARDYKHRASRRSKRKQAPGWLWLTAGLAIGLFVAFLIYLQQRPDAAPSKTTTTTTQTPAQTPAPVAQKDAREVRKTPNAKVPPPPKPRFDFYTILPEMEVVVPEQEITGKQRAGVREVEAPGTYLLQVGSFRSLQQADQLKAKLALIGLQAGIQTVTLSERDTWHRVRVGPFKDLSALNTARARLKENKIDAILLRVGEG
ncbi:MAG: SPOR domain-containing protein [Gammaproteobacteria bacterium]|nr:SPOR domain-containing protein [Gammaproteobacteria bacterium]